MGGEIPRSVDIHNPRLATKVTIDIPESSEFDTDNLYCLFKRHNVIELCMETLRKVPEWKYLMEGEMIDGRSLQLAWRVKANLDWVWLDDDVFGKPRDWSVLCGLGFKQVAFVSTSLHFDVWPNP